MSVDVSAKEVPVTVRIYRPFGEAALTRERGRLETALGVYVPKLLGGLQINRIPVVKIELDDDRYDSLRPVRVSIDGEACRQPIQEAWSTRRFRDSLPALIEEIVCENRALFVSDRLARDCRRTWGLSAEADAWLHDFVRRLAGSGYSLATAKLWLDGNVSTDVPPDSAFEEAAAGRQIPIRVGLADTDRDTLEDATERLRGRLIRLGAGAPEIIVSFEELADDVAFHVRINDLWLPAVRRASLGENAVELSAEVLLDGIAENVAGRLACLITTATVVDQLEHLGHRYPALRDELASRYDDLTLAHVLRGLALERVPIYDLRSIAERMLTSNGSTVAGNRMRRIVFTPETAHFIYRLEPPKMETPQTLELTENIRSGLSRHIAAAFAHDGWVQAILVDPTLELRFAASAPSGLDPHQIRQLVRDTAAIRAEWRDQNADSPATPVVLIAAEVRASASRVFGEGFTDLPVLAYQELNPDISINPIGRAKLPELSAHCPRIRERLASRDQEIDTEIESDLASTETVDPMLYNLASMNAAVQKLNLRQEALLAATTDEEREFLTEELCLLEAEMARTDYTKGLSTSFEVVDIVSDLFNQSKRASN